MQTIRPSASLFTESEKLAQVVDKFAKQLKVCALAWEDTTNTAESNDLLIHFIFIINSCKFT